MAILKIKLGNGQNAFAVIPGNVDHETSLVGNSLRYTIDRFNDWTNDPTAQTIQDIYAGAYVPVNCGGK